MIISRYVFREIFNTTFAVTIVLLLAFLSQQLVRYLNYVAVGRIPTELFLQLLYFEVPYLSALLLPLGLYLGILLTFGRLYVDNEMMMINLCGFNHTQLIRLILSITFLISMIILLLMLWVNPYISDKRQHLMTSDQSTLHMIQTLIPGRFQASPDGQHVIYAESLSRDHQRAKQVFLAKQMKAEGIDQINTWMLVFAKEGYQKKANNMQDQFFVTTNGHRYEGIPGQNDYRLTQFEKYEIRIPPAEVHLNHQEEETLATQTLWKNYDDPKKAAELQWRFSIAIVGLLLALLAIPFSEVKPRKGRYLILFPAIVIYLVYFDLLFIARRWLEQGTVPIIIGLWWVHVLMAIFVISFYLIKKFKPKPKYN